VGVIGATLVGLLLLLLLLLGWQSHAIPHHHLHEHCPDDPHTSIANTQYILCVYRFIALAH
jgi:hypothetical protein